MIFDPTINVGSIVIVMLGLISAYVALRSSLAGMSTKVGVLTERVGFVEINLKEMNKIMISNAVTEERLAALRDDLSAYMVSCTNADTEFKGWVRSTMNRLEAENKKLELRLLTLSLSKPSAELD